MAERKRPDAPATKYVQIVRKLNVIRELCLAYIREQKELKAPLIEKSRDEIVQEWANDYIAWNESRGGLTLAEIYLGTMCHHALAIHPEWYDPLTLRYKSVVSVYRQLKNAALDPLSVDAERLFRVVAVIMVIILSDDLDTVIGYVCDDLSTADKPADTKQEDWKIMCETEAGVCVRGFIPMASRFFWYYWCENVITMGAVDRMEEEKGEEQEKFDKWIDSQFAIQQQTSYAFKLSELMFQDAISMGGHLFSRRGDSSQILPSASIARMDLNDETIKKLDADQMLSPTEINDDTKNSAHLIGKLHMFMYTFDNRLRTSAKRMPFDPYIVFKHELPKFMDELLNKKTDKLTRRPKRPTVVQTHTGWLLQYLECTCEHASLLLHVPSVKSCILKTHLIKFTREDLTKALRLWCVIMKRDFNCLLADGTSIERFLDECL